MEDGQAGEWTSLAGIRGLIMESQRGFMISRDESDDLVSSEKNFLDGSVRNVQALKSHQVQRGPMRHGKDPYIHLREGLG